MWFKIWVGRFMCIVPGSILRCLTGTPCMPAQPHRNTETENHRWRKVKFHIFITRGRAVYFCASCNFYLFIFSIRTRWVYVRPVCTFFLLFLKCWLRKSCELCYVLFVCVCGKNCNWTSRAVCINKPHSTDFIFYFHHIKPRIICHWDSSVSSIHWCVMLSTLISRNIIGTPQKLIPFIS